MTHHVSRPGKTLALLCLTLLCGLAAGITRAELRPLPEPANPKLPSLFLIGDSTVRNGSGTGGNGQWGWGEPLAELFNPRKVNVVNRAMGGLSSRTYLTSGYWEATLALIKPGDVVIMQFGHNDSGPLNDEKRARGTIRGSGDETEEIDNVLTGQHEVVHTYGWYLRKFIQDAKVKGAQAIVCSPVPRKSWNGDKVNRASGSYGLWARQAAEAEGVPFVDLNEIIARRYEGLGKEKVEAMFADKHTHTTLLGAKLNAQGVVAGLRALPGKPLEGYLSSNGKRIKPAAAETVVMEDERPILEDTGTTEQAATGAIPTLYIIGDSTVKNGHAGGVGWGEVIGQLFDSSKINVVNRAIGGRSTRTYLREGRWDNVRDSLKPGDFVIMQFGHNDGGKVGDPRFKRRPALPGIGDDTQDITLDDGTVETVHSYGWYLQKFCREAKAKGATAIICSPVPHKNNWKDGRFTPDFQGHREWGRQSAQATDAYFIDLTAVIGVVYQKLGEAKVDTLFADARTHTNAAGAQINAECVVAGLKALPGGPLNAYLANDADAIKPAIGLVSR